MKSSITNLEAELAFTLVELLVVVAIIVVLVALLVPAMEKAMSRATLARCLTQQKGVYQAMFGYLMENKGRLFDNRNRHRWHPGTPGSVDESKYIPYTHGDAYWGGAYRAFGAVKKAFLCPDATASQADYDLQFTQEAWSDGSWAAGHRYTTYGLNGINDPTIKTPFFVGGKSVKNTSWKNPASSLLFMDTYESNMEGGGDTPYQFNQAEWMSVPAAKEQHYRHLLGPAMAWGDGHVAHHQPKFGWEPNEIFGDFPKRWFSGE